ncbi:MAG: maleylpyruvate isomerase N-terminal domain-containing protein [Acidimicrobiales bacterium]
MDLVATFFSAAPPARRLLACDEVAAAWDRPSALAGYTVGGLAGHLHRATSRTEHLLSEPEPASARVVRPAEFFGAARIDTDIDRDNEFQRSVRAVGEEVGTRGPAALATAFANLLERLRPLVASTPPGRLVAVLTIPDAATRFDDYLRTRIVELVVHADDLAASVGVQAPDPGADATEVVVGVLVELARARSGDLGVIRGLARSERAEPGSLRAL